MPKFLTRHVKYVVFPNNAVTFFDAVLSKYGSLRVVSSNEFCIDSPAFPVLPFKLPRTTEK